MRTIKASSIFESLFDPNGNIRHVDFHADGTYNPNPSIRALEVHDIGTIHATAIANAAFSIAQTKEPAQCYDRFEQYLQDAGFVPPEQ